MVMRSENPKIKKHKIIEFVGAGFIPARGKEVKKSLNVRKRERVVIRTADFGVGSEKIEGQKAEEQKNRSRPRLTIFDDDYRLSFESRRTEG